MEYRKLPHGDEMISVIGMGTSTVGEFSEKNVEDTVNFALDAGINYIDMAGGHAAIFPGLGRVLEARRKEVMLQVHFGADYTSGVYGWDLRLNAVKRSIDWQLKNLKTDYIDFGFMHCIDEMSDLKSYEKNGVLKFIMDLKEQGVVKHIALSTHTPAIADKVLDEGIIDMLMFSLNPMYDYGQGDYSFGALDERSRLYRRCEREGVGISVMKPFNSGILLDARRSPFHKAMTPVQCISYALDRPGVLTVLGGAADIPQLKEMLRYLDATDEEKDYSMMGAFSPDEIKGECVYCKHCHPCPAGLDIGLINKYYDLNKAGDILAGEHYRTLEKTASDCIMCGHCNERCPFHVDQMDHMKEIAGYFGK